MAGCDRQDVGDQPRKPAMAMADWLTNETLPRLMLAADLRSEIVARGEAPVGRTRSSLDHASAAFSVQNRLCHFGPNSGIPSPTAGSNPRRSTYRYSYYRARMHGSDNIVTTRVGLTSFLRS